ncbi:hypothetical protein N2152v2_005437 [Parachlorella kessleri]
MLALSHIYSLRPRAFPGGPLTWVREAIHYLDLGGVQATNLRDFGGSQGFWGGVTKLYASDCGLRRLDGIAQLSRVIWLYLDNNQLCEAELLRLLSGIPAGQLKALDISGNVGCTDEVLAALEAATAGACTTLPVPATEPHVTDAGSSNAAVDVSQYVAGLQELRALLVKAKEEQERLEKQLAEAAAAQKALETENGKLKYQVLHLKRAVVEGDEKLAAVRKDGKQ